MKNRKYYIDLLCTQIESNFGRKADSPKNISFIAGEIERISHTHISATTLKRLFGYIPYPHNPNTFTLNVLARAIGEENFESFVWKHTSKKQSISVNDHEEKTVQIGDHTRILIKNFGNGKIKIYVKANK